MTLQRKFLSTTTSTSGLDERQVRVVASTPAVDRAGDIVVAEGINLAAYKANPVILWNHDPGSPIARCVEIGVNAGQLEAVAQFPPEGTDPLADRVYGLIKAGVVNATSIGFAPVEETPIKGGGVTVSRSELWEFSFVSVPANPEALVVERSAPAAAPVPAVPPPRLKTKGLYAVSWLAGLLAELGYIEENVAWEAEAEGDASPVPEMLAEALRQLGTALVAMTAEEVAELLGDDADDG
ncbi:MAG: HK97 family phage prohead protease, partial [Magnetospirillum sp.]|nr:HK97 family phage prohead protease [Magnetospirillum sp.]